MTGDYRVYKYPIPMDDIVYIAMHKGARLLHVDVQHGNPCVWAMIETSEPVVQRKLRVAGTGHPLQLYGNEPHVGTLMMAGGSLVFHVFDLGEA